MRLRAFRAAAHQPQAAGSRGSLVRLLASDGFPDGGRGFTSGRLRQIPRATARGGKRWAQDRSDRSGFRTTGAALKPILIRRIGRNKRHGRAGNPDIEGAMQVLDMKTPAEALRSTPTPPRPLART